MIHLHIASILRRTVRILIGLIVTIGALCIASFLFAIIAVLMHFPGNTVFPVDCAVVFGSAVRQGSEAGPGITRRVETAVDLLKEGRVNRLFLTGGVGEGNTASEAKVMRDVALEMGVVPEVITLEENAESTWQNIKFVRSSLTDCEDVVGISDRYHLARIRLAASRLDTPMMVFPAKRHAGFFFELWTVFREALGILAYAVLPSSTIEVL